mgnify:CR=1 FL=1
MDPKTRSRFEQAADRLVDQWLREIVSRGIWVPKFAADAERALRRLIAHALKVMFQAGRRHGE